MILIFANANDPAPNSVIDWLYKWEFPFFRINEFSKISIESLVISNGQEDLNYTLLVNNLKIEYCDIVSVWFRQSIDLKFTLNYLDESSINKNEIKQFFDSETASLFLFFIHSLEQKKCIGRFSLQNTNKLIFLEYAKKVGFKIPKTYLFSRDSFSGELISNNKLITKSIQDICILNDANSDTFEINYTEMVRDDDFNLEFGLSLFQECLIPSEIVRVFYLDKFFCSCLIFSGVEESTQSIDSRLYKFKKFININLPLEIEEKIIHFAKNSNLNTGSIDFLIYQDEYYFLEVNPVGQFGFISHQHNGLIDLKIAEYLESK